MDQFRDFFRIHGTTMILGLVALYFVVKNAVKNGIKSAFSEMKVEENPNEAQRTE